MIRFVALNKNKMDTTKRQVKPIDEVTTNNLQAALKMCDIHIPIQTLDKIIDLVELIEEKGDAVTIGDIFELQEEWRRSHAN